MFNGFLIFYILILYAFIVIARKNKNFKAGLLVSMLVANLTQMGNISDVFNSSIILVILYEVAMLIINYIILKLTYNISTMNRGIFLKIVGIIASIGLVAIYFYLGNIILFISI